MKNKIITILVVILVMTGTSSLQAWPWSKTIQEQYMSSLSEGLNKNKQEIFNHFHPVGTAKSIKLHAVDIKW